MNFIMYPTVNICVIKEKKTAQVVRLGGTGTGRGQEALRVQAGIPAALGSSLKRKVEPSVWTQHFTSTYLGAFATAATVCK